MLRVSFPDQCLGRGRGERVQGKVTHVTGGANATSASELSGSGSRETGLRSRRSVGAWKWKRRENMTKGENARRKAVSESVSAQRQCF